MPPSLQRVLVQSMGDRGADDDTAPEQPRKPLEGLAQRLGALEESLTVVASEMGMAASPRFKRLDPDQVYREAVRRAQESAEPLRIALRRLEARLDEIVLAQAQLRREILAVREDAAVTQALAALTERIEAVAAPVDRHERLLEDVEAGRASLMVRLAALEDRTAPPNASAPIVEDGSPTGPSENDLAALLAGVDARIERRLQEAATTPTDRAAIEAEVARQIEAMQPDAAGEHNAVNPLVMGAAERAIVRLTRRIEKLEERRSAGDSARGTRGGRGLMGRLFES